MQPEIIQGDITTLNVGAIVNSANEYLLSGKGGVNGAIHKAAGPELLEECREIIREKYSNGISIGQAVITKGYNLPAKHVIHAVGPVYDGKEESANLLGDVYMNSLGVAKENGLQSIAFPAIGTRTSGYPKEEALNIVKKVIDEFPFDSLKKLVLCYFSAEDTSLAKRIFYHHKF